MVCARRRTRLARSGAAGDHPRAPGACCTQQWDVKQRFDAARKRDTGTYVRGLLGDAMDARAQTSENPPYCCFERGGSEYICFGPQVATPAYLSASAALSSP